MRLGPERAFGRRRPPGQAVHAAARLRLGHEAGQAGRHRAADAGKPRVRGEAGPVVRHADRPARPERRQPGQHGRRRETAGGHRRLHPHLRGQRARVRAARPDLHDDPRAVGQGDGRDRADAQLDGADGGRAETPPGRPVQDHAPGGLPGRPSRRRCGRAADPRRRSSSPIIAAHPSRSRPGGAGPGVIRHRIRLLSANFVTPDAPGRDRNRGTPRPFSGPPRRRGTMREARIELLGDYLGLIDGFHDRAACFRGAKDPVDDMRPTVVRSAPQPARCASAAAGRAGSSSGSTRRGWSRPSGAARCRSSRRCRTAT